MIGIDSNVLIYAVIDSADPIKAAKAKKVISDNAPVFVNTVVLAEFAWTCKQSFAMERLEIHRRLEAIVASPEFEFAHPEALAKAVAGYGSRMSDFDDWLIGETNLDHGCTVTLTFDKGAAKTAAFKAVPT